MAPNTNGAEDSATPSNNAQIELILSLLRHDQAATKYQEQLESEIRQNKSAYRQLLGHCIQLEGKLCEVEHMKSRFETAMDHAIEDNKALYRALDLEKAKTKDAEGRVASLCSINQSLLSFLG
ncbi:hypothetical protein BDV26DRAFT_299092 [Aspergillus bertholletiae]|uniref:Uncharacterized protein n=1 Tax=Aspergillus bertholletiae TaxID=1226010 RepID=A0A5N7AQT2_9EURO|nr:hypothetical protein BDV26DRAFT_299092 [Aspergillus bertholletiae]